MRVTVPVDATPRASTTTWDVNSSVVEKLSKPQQWRSEGFVRPGYAPAPVLWRRVEGVDRAPSNPGRTPEAAGADALVERGGS